MTDRPSLIARRFEELAAQATKIRTEGHQSRAANAEQFYAWASSALNLLQGVMGTDSPHTEQFRAKLEAIQNNYVSDRHLEAMRGIFLGAKSDVDGGYIFEAEATLSAEIFGDFVSAAKAALADGHYTVAAVLASAALEDALKRYAIACNLNVTGKSMSDVVNALKSVGVVSGAQKSLLSSMPKLRDYAMHAEWDKLTPQDAGSIIGYVEQFLLTQFQANNTMEPTR